jgi:16S rRNA (guanine966-N2)-methyltransferase
MRLSPPWVPRRREPPAREIPRQARPVQASEAVAKGRAGGGGQLRIVGGRHRGRRLPIPSQPGLRPTTDRTRETLFNWLAPVIAGSRCLDCFAGSGALGFEAASRGARVVCMLERSALICRQLRANAAKLGDEWVSIINGDALAWLSASPAQQFDLVFLDPPFGHGLLAPTCDLLQRRGWLAPGALIYLEAPAADGFPALPPSWVPLRDKRAGAVRFGLVALESERDLIVT